MTIQGPPNDETPPSGPPDDGHDDARTDPPEQRAPGPESSPVGAPRDEPDPQG